MRQTIKAAGLASLLLLSLTDLSAEPLVKGYFVEKLPANSLSQALAPGKGLVLAHVLNQSNEAIVTGNYQVGVQIEDKGSIKTYSLSPKDSITPGALKTFRMAVPIEGIDTTRFIKAPPIPREELEKRFHTLVDSIKEKDCKLILDYFIKKFGEQIYISPAASSVHHEFASGLLMHSVSLGEHADYFSKYYPDLNRDLLVTGALLHDFGKMIELEGPAVYHYSVEGKLLGHISIMCGELRIAAKELNITSEIPLLLEHMVLSHHGQLEFGSPIMPLTKEALLLSMIDNLDSKMLVLEKAYEDVLPGEFTQKVYALDGRAFYKQKK